MIGTFFLIDLAFHKAKLTLGVDVSVGGAVRL